MTKEKNQESPIGFFDSGVGGLTVLQEIAKALPHENLLYLGDTAHFPYGNKLPEQILKIARSNAQFLMSKSIKLLVISCYTACSHAFEILRRELPIPVISVANFGIQEVVNSTITQSVAILGTHRTIESGILQSHLLDLNPQLNIHAIACPLLAPFAEEGLENHSRLEKVARGYLSPLKNTNVDCTLLGCTHYPLIATTLKKILGPGVQLIAPGIFCAAEVKALLTNINNLNPNVSTPSYQFYSSEKTSTFQQRVQIILKNSNLKVVRT